MFAASRLRTVSNRLALASLKSLAIKTSVPALFTRVTHSRQYATKENRQVSYTVDKFPGYVRNENYKEVRRFFIYNDFILTCMI